MNVATGGTETDEIALRSVHLSQSTGHETSHPKHDWLRRMDAETGSHKKRQRSDFFSNPPLMRFLQLRIVNAMRDTPRLRITDLRVANLVYGYHVAVKWNKNHKTTWKSQQDTLAAMF